MPEQIQKNLLDAYSQEHHSGRHYGCECPAGQHFTTEGCRLTPQRPHIREDDSVTVTIEDHHILLHSNHGERD
jgi:hypothetical protein